MVVKDKKTKKTETTFKEFSLQGFNGRRDKGVFEAVEWLHFIRIQTTNQ